MHITFICTGNTCRSPMAEGIARKIIAEHYPDSGITVSSAGIAAQCGSPASAHSIDVCREIGVDLSAHRARYIDPEVLWNTDLFVAMSSYHAEALLIHGVPNRKILILGGGVPDPCDGDKSDYRFARNLIYLFLEMLLRELTYEKHCLTEMWRLEPKYRLFR